MNRALRARVRGVRLLLWLLIVPSLALTRMTDVHLNELVKQSDVIVFGHVSSAETANIHLPLGTVRFKIKSVLKGREIVHDQKALLLCNPHSNSELPDLSKTFAEKIVFLTQGKNCYDLSHGYVSLVEVVGGLASTYAITGEPQSQPLTSFVNQVRAIVSSH